MRKTTSTNKGSKDWSRSDPTLEVQEKAELQKLGEFNAINQKEPPNVQQAASENSVLVTSFYDSAKESISSEFGTSLKPAENNDSVIEILDKRQKFAKSYMDSTTEIFNFASSDSELVSGSAKRLSMYGAKGSVRQSCEHILRNRQDTKENKSKALNEPINLYTINVSTIEQKLINDGIRKDEIEKYRWMLENQNCYTTIIGETGCIYEFAKGGVTVINMQKPRETKAEVYTKNVVVKAPKIAKAHTYYCLPKSIPVRSSDIDIISIKSKSPESYEKHLLLPCCLSASSDTCVVLGNKFVSKINLVKYSIPKMFGVKNLTKERRYFLAVEPPQVKLNNYDEKSDEILSGKRNVTSEIDENDYFIDNPTIIRYAQQQNRLKDKIQFGVVTESDILEGVCQIMPDYRKWSFEIGGESEVNDVPSIDFNTLTYLTYFYKERLKNDDAYHLKAYVVEGYYPICMLLESGIPKELEICPEVIKQLDERLQNYLNGNRTYNHHYNEVNAYYMINGYYRALCYRSRTMENPMKRSFAAATFELYLTRKPEGRLSYQDFLYWICGNEFLVTAVDSEERIKRQKESILTYQTDEIVRFLNKSAYDYFHYQKKLPPSDPLAVRSDIEYKKVSPQELYATCSNRPKESCPVTGCSCIIKLNQHLAHFIEEHAIPLTELWLGHRGVLFFNPILYPDCSNTFCLGTIALNIGYRELRYQNTSLPRECDDIQDHYPIVLMYCKLDEYGTQYYFWAMTNSLANYIDIEIVMSVYPMNMAQVKTMVLPIVTQKDFSHVLHLISYKQQQVFNIKYNQMKTLTQDFTQFICLDVKIIKAFKPSKLTSTASSTTSTSTKSHII